LHRRRVAVQRGYAVFTVNAFGVRNSTEHDEEFTNLAIHEDFPDLIGDREIWIDERLFENEGLFCVANALTRLRAREHGAAEAAAYEAGNNVERLLRARLVGVKYRAGRAHRRVPRRIYDRRYAALPDVKRTIEVCLVHGDLVRSYYKTDYVEGGHGYVYSWVPKAQIWLEHDVDPAELPYAAAHEYLELRLMRDRGLHYDRAHAIAARLEYDLRVGGQAREVLGLDGRKPTVRDLPKLTAPSYFDHVVKHYVRGA
jgi:hypothetical protein